MRKDLKVIGRQRQGPLDLHLGYRRHCKLRGSGRGGTGIREQGKAGTGSTRKGLGKQKRGPALSLRDGRRQYVQVLYSSTRLPCQACTFPPAASAAGGSIRL